MEDQLMKQNFRINRQMKQLANDGMAAAENGKAPAEEGEAAADEELCEESYEE